MSRVFPPVDRSSKAVSFVDEIMSRISIEKSWKIPEIKPSGQEIPAYDAFVKSMVKRLDRLPIRVKRVLIKKRYGLHKALKSKSEEENKQAKVDKFEEDWFKYCQQMEFVNFTPTPDELGVVALVLKIRIQAFFSIWHRQDTNTFTSAGKLAFYSDYGPDFWAAIPIVFYNDDFKIFEFRKDVAVRGEFSKCVMDDAMWTTKKAEYYKKKELVGELKNGEIEDPGRNDGFLYKMLGMPPSQRFGGVVDYITTFKQKWNQANRMFHEDRLLTDGAFNPTLGTYGPQTKHEATKIYEYYAEGGMKDMSETVVFAWQIFCDPVCRAIYHFEGLYPPLRLKNKGFRPGSEEDDRSNTLSSAFAEYNTEAGEGVDYASKRNDTIRPLAVHVLFKAKEPKENHRLLKVEQDLDQLALKLAGRTRDKLVDHFRERFVYSSASRLVKGAYYREPYAVMVPVRMIGSDVSLKGDDFKVFDVFSGET